MENAGEIMTVLYVCKLMEFSLDLEVLTISLCTKKNKTNQFGPHFTSQSVDQKLGLPVSNREHGELSS